MHNAAKWRAERSLHGAKKSPRGCKADDTIHHDED